MIYIMFLTKLFCRKNKKIFFKQNLYNMYYNNIKISRFFFQMCFNFFDGLFR